MKISPFPTISTDGAQQTSRGIVHETPKYCIDNCRKDICRKEYSDLSFKDEPTFKECHKGFLICSFAIFGNKYVIHGMIDEHNYIKNRSIFKKLYFSNLINRGKILYFIDEFKALDRSYYKNLGAKIKNHIQPYHDIKRLVGTIVTNIEKIAKTNNPQLKINQAVDKLEGPLESIYITTQLIDLYTTTVDAFSSPETLKSGTSRRRGVYKAFDKMSRILQSKAAQKRIKINFFGTDFTEIHAYDSLDLLPFILIDNAIKYSAEGYEIDIKFSKNHEMLVVEIQNTGCEILKDDMETIFKKFHRGQNANKFTSEGSGVGLYLAKEIASHHNAKIECCSEALDYAIKDASIAKISFKVLFTII